MHVYIMKAADRIKIGISKHPAQRRKALGRSVEVVYQSEPTACARQIERLSHDILTRAGLHHHGEWFNASVDQGIAAIRTATAESLDKPSKGRLVPVQVLLEHDDVAALLEYSEREGVALSRITRRALMAGMAAALKEAAP